MKEIKLDRPFNLLAGAPPMGYFIVVQPGSEFSTEDEVEISIDHYPFPQPIYGHIEDVITYDVSVDPGITIKILLKLFYGFSYEWILNRLNSMGVDKYQILGVRSVTYIY